MKSGAQNGIFLSALSIAISAVASTVTAAETNVPDAGLLNQQLQQSQPQNKIKPSGEFFNNQVLSQQGEDNSNIRFKLENVQLVGIENEGIEEDLSPILQQYLHKEMSLNDLNKLSQEITQYYREHNYLVARAILPPQEIQNGQVRIQIIKGKLGQIHIENQSALRESFVQRMANTSLGDELFLQKSQLENLALLLNDVQGVKPALSLKAGAEKGSSDLTISLENTKRFAGYVALDNQGNKDTGEYRLTLGGKAYNLLGFGDDLSVSVLGSQNANLKSAALDYSGLIDGYGTRLGVNANYLSYKLGGNFKDLNAKGHSHNLGVYIAHPSIRLPNFRLTTKVAFNHQELKDRQNAVDLLQKRKINTVNLSLNGSWNSIKNGISYFSLATTFGKEGNSSNEKVQYQAENFKQKKSFTVFNYSLSHEQSLPKSLALNIGINGQLADKNLDSSQKMLLGGLYAVRGYKSGAASVDEGHILQAELKHYLPVLQTSILTSSVFYDYGWGKYYKNTDLLANEVENKVKLQSIGAGLSLSAPNNYALNLAIAKPIGAKLEKTDKHRFWLSAIKTF